MSSRGTSTSRPQSSAQTEENIFEKLDIILCMSKYLGFRDYHNFVRALWPHGDEVEEVQAKLWKLSTHQVTTEFLNGQEILVIYNYDPWRTAAERLLIDVRSLSGIFGAIGADLMDQFASVSTLHTFIMEHVHMDGCSALRHADCLCHLGNHESLLGRTVPESPAKPCTQGCSHHYCSEHVRYWLDVYLLPAIYYSPAFSDYR
ncbi:repeat element protein-b18.1 [Ichnoviriform fugitivi]|uniref:Repeat element protein-b18.1 n=1 Tax=Ichnoviriform fugitivi TaxID=265522 RepID=A2Q0F7_9VIRU|nr:repeat element protein-b18.1 [Ichnoviriform fugitivi]BAF45672.1 repeat element protein-b18.1 [Ichnoviriform fugitivi]